MSGLSGGVTLVRGIVSQGNEASCGDLVGVDSRSLLLDASGRVSYDNGGVLFGLVKMGGGGGS